MPDEDKDIVVDESDDGEQTPENKEPDVKTLQAQKTHWREKAKKLETELETAKSKIPPEKPEEKPVETKQDDAEWKQKIEFTVLHKEYDSEDINKLLTLSKGLGVGLEKASEDPMFKAYYNAKQEEIAKKDTTPPGGRFPKVAPVKPIEEMTKEEHQAHFQKVLNG